MLISVSRRRGGGGGREGGGGGWFFFFQAEDGIRDWSVTGVQTCALPICTLNLLYIIMVHFIFLTNSGERLAFNNFGLLVFIALAIVIAWLLALPILIVKQVKSSNQ